MDNLSSKKSKFKLKNFLIAMFVLMIGIGAYSVYTSGYTIEDGVVMKDADNAKRNGLLKNLKDKKDTEKIIVNTKSFKDIKEQAKKADKVYKSDDTYVLEFNSEEEKESIEKELNKKDVNIEKSYELKVSENEQKTTSEKTDETSSNEVWTDNKISDVIQKNKVTVAVIDSGLNISDVEKSRIVGGYSFTDSDWKTDENGHGTDIYINSINPIRENYTFLGWNTEKDGSGTTYKAEDLYNYTGTKNVTLYAQWKSKTYTNTLNYNANGGTGAPITQTAKVTYPNTASTFTVSTTKPTRTGYTFAGWYTAASGGTKVGTTYIVGKNNQEKNQSATLYAQWTANKYTNTLYYDANGGNGAPASQTASVTYPNTASKFTVSTTKPSRTGYTFIGWYTAASGGTKVGTEYTVGSKDQAKNQSATLYAHWTANNYTVTLQPSGGSLNIGDGSITKNSDGSATFKVIYDTTNYYNLGITASKTGYQVNGFYDNTSGGKKLWNNGGACLNDGTYWLNNKWHYAGDVTLYVQWTANTYTIKYDGNGATGGSTASSNHTYDSAKTLTPNGFVKTGYTFNGWNTQANGKGTSYSDKASVKNLTAVNNSTVTLYAQWKANTYTVTYDSNKPANASTTISGTMSKDTATYNQNYTTRANGYTLLGYTFVGWNEKADGTGTD